MLADPEATDPFFAEKYFGGDTTAFLEACDRSVAASQDYLGQIAAGYACGIFEATSFFRMFGRERFEETQRRYTERLLGRYPLNGLPRVDNDIRERSALNRNMYGRAAGDHDFIVDRTIRTMAQYLTLGELVGRDPQSCFIVHDTVNGSLLRSMNQFDHREDTTHPIETPTIIKNDLRVY